MYLEKIHSPKDLKTLSLDEKKVLAQEIRDALTEKLSRHGGHAGPNYGSVEAIIALHSVFDSPEDKIVFDVSHQSYPHKMLTGRAQAFLDPEHYDDVSGYTDPDESEHDFFNMGHTSSSIALAEGMAKARDLLGGKEKIIAFIGDGSMSGGVALEALNAAGDLDSNLIIIFNDNDMSIAENHGGMYGEFARLRQSEGKDGNNLFKAMGLDYRFVPDGNDLEAMIQVLEEVKDIDHPIVLHMVTEKGKGYAPAEENKEAWHFTGPFDPETGRATFSDSEESYGEATGQYLMDKIQKDPAVIVMAAGVPGTINFDKARRDAAGKQYLDLAIAEQNAVSMASGLAKRGAKPVFATQATFYQRAYDQMSHDTAMNNSPAVYLMANGSVYGMNDKTHLGFFDIPMFSNIPNVVFLVPTNMEEYLAMLDWAIDQDQHTVVMRMPAGKMIHADRPVRKNYDALNTSEMVRKGSKVALIGVGAFLDNALKTADLLKERYGLEATVINPQFVSGLDTQMLEDLKKDHALVMTVEDGILDGGYAQKVASFYGDSDMKVLSKGLEKEFIDRYDAAELMQMLGLMPEQLADQIAAALDLE